MGGVLNGTHESNMCFDHEELIGEIEQGETTARLAMDNHTFVVRSSDMKFRAKIVTMVNHEPESNDMHPFKLRFKNIMLEGTPMELKLSTSGYVWLDPGHALEHLTDVFHNFDLRDKANTPIVSVHLLMPRKD